MIEASLEKLLEIGFKPIGQPETKEPHFLQYTKYEKDAKTVRIHLIAEQMKEQEYFIWHARDIGGVGYNFIDIDEHFPETNLIDFIKMLENTAPKPICGRPLVNPLPTDQVMGIAQNFYRDTQSS